MGHFYFVRHGQTVWNVEGKICGATDIALTQLGHEQAIETGKKILEEHIQADEILYSPLMRAADTAKHIAEKNPATVEELLEQKALADESKTIKDILTDKIATIGENMSIRRFARFETDGLIETYTHGDGKIGVMVEFAKGTSEVARDVCMQIAAARPEYLDRDSVPADRVAHEMEILKAQAVNEGKPEAVAEKIVQGRIGKFYGEICLVEQDFVKDPDQKVGKLVESKGAKVVRFARFEKGEGLQKREENFAEEVAKQING